MISIITGIIMFINPFKDSILIDWGERMERGKKREDRKDREKGREKAGWQEGRSVLIRIGNPAYL